ncbi:MAG: 50S ribosomal protein L10, partial [Muribaculaceae bacterium]|nr:50S ribosomal protein L10 [Muribaculaceae bacterium]
MKKEDKAIIINQIAETIKSYGSFYLVETAGLNAEKTSELRRACFNADIKLMVVKNTLLHKALESLEGDYSELYPALKESTSLMCTNVR